jgi:hypothetical protein
MYCLRLGHDEVAEVILTHPVAKVLAEIDRALN